MRAMILAAGRGERMRPLTDKTPKPLLIVGGKPLIVWHLERLKAAGFEQVVINHAYLGQQIEQYLGNGQQWGLSIRYSRETNALETAGGIANAMPLLTDQGQDVSPFLVVNADIYTDIDFASIKLSGKDLLHLVMVNNPPQHPNGDFAVIDNRLSLISTQQYTFSGVGIYHPALFENIEQGQVAKLAPFIRTAITEHRAAATIHSGQWDDIGTPERLHQINMFISQSRSNP